MRLFGKRKDKILDLTKRYEKQQARAEEMKSPQAYPEIFPTDISTGGKDMQESQGSSENAGGLGFFGAIGNTVSQSSNDSEYVDISSGVDEKRRKLAKRLMEMTNKIEELSNQIYHLQQRIEVLEKKGGVGGY